MQRNSMYLYIPMWLEYLKESGDRLPGVWLHAWNIFKQPEQMVSNRIDCTQ